MILNGKLVDSTRVTLHIWLKSPVPMVRCLLISVYHRGSRPIFKSNPPEMHDTFVSKTTGNLFFMQFLGCDLITSQGRPYKVYIIMGSILSRYKCRALTVVESLFIVIFSVKVLCILEDCLDRYILHSFHV